MIIQFSTEDDSIFVVDMDESKWARVSKIPRPEDPTDDSEILESGKIIPQTLEAMTWRVYALEGRTPRTPAPAEGLSAIGLAIPIPRGTLMEIYFRANVEAKDFTVLTPIESIKYINISAKQNPVNQLQGDTSAQDGGTENGRSEVSAD